VEKLLDNDTIQQMKILVAILLLVVAPWTKIIINPPDAYCWHVHPTSSTPPAKLITAQDYFNLGDYDFDSGDCVQAVVAYTQAIHLNSTNVHVYNNRAYTNMRLHNYQFAINDLNKAIELNPNYATAYMNRGDIYNYYYAIDRQKAIADYDKVIALGKEKDRSRSVCGHKAMAETQDMIPLAILKVFLNKGKGC